MPADFFRQLGEECLSLRAQRERVHIACRDRITGRKDVEKRGRDVREKRTGGKRREEVGEKGNKRGETWQWREIRLSMGTPRSFFNIECRMKKKNDGQNGKIHRYMRIFTAIV